MSTDSIEFNFIVNGSAVVTTSFDKNQTKMISHHANNSQFTDACDNWKRMAENFTSNTLTLEYKEEPFNRCSLTVKKKE